MLVSVFLVPGQPVIAIHARADGPGRLHGHIAREVRQGQSFLGWSYDDLVKMGTAMHDLEPRPGPMPAGEVFLQVGQIYSR